MLARSQVVAREDAPALPGGMRRGVRTDTGRSVLVRAAEAGSDGLIARSRVRNEKALLDRCDGDGLLRPDALVEDERGLLLVFPDPGVQPLSYLEPRPELPDFLDTALAAAEALAAAHGAGVVHGGLDPDEILVAADGGPGLWLTGFGDGAVLGAESLAPVELTDGDVRLPYVSPEQTGRMNRAIDHRTDLYSLGVVLYEYLTGTLPFAARDAMGWVHAHIAQKPDPALAFRTDVPPVVSAILDRLLAKNPDDRYQSAAGLAADLRQARERWSPRTGLADFPLGLKDRPLRFSVPDRLYGRDDELAGLLAHFEQTLDGGSGAVFVDGRSGIGKSRLIRELHRPVVTHHAWFVQGKFDQYRRGQPYLGLLRALTELVRQMLTEPEDRVAAWRDLLLDAVGPNGQVIIDVVPELEFLLGPQPVVPDLPSSETTQRFTLTLLAFVQAVASGGRTLVLFLDDLQWADTPSLSLLEALLTHHATRNLLVVGAYRGDEVGDEHPLRRTEANLEQAEVALDRVSLGPLAARDVAALVADALGRTREESRELAAAVVEKTAGNPFFIAQFLRRLHDDGVISWDAGDGCWQWDGERLAAAGYTDNVVELMADRLRDMVSTDGQETLRTAAFLGTRFELSALADVLGRDVVDVGPELREAVDAGLVLPEGDALRVLQSEATDRRAWFRFLHDKVQEAAYAAVPASERADLHLEAGRRLLARTPDDRLDEVLFDVIGHTGHALDRITDPAERLRLAAVHLRGGERAIDSVAHDLGRTCFERGIDLLPDDAWTAHYDLALALHVGAAEADYLTGHREEAVQRAAAVREHARDVLDQVPVLELGINHAFNEFDFAACVRLGREVLGLLDVDLPEAGDPATFPAKVGEIMVELGERHPKMLIELDEVDDPRAEAAQRIMATLVPTLALSRQDLFPLVIFEAVLTSLRHGLSPASSVACSCYGLLLCAQGQYQAGAAFGDLALAIVDRYPDSPLCNPVYTQVAGFVDPYTRPLQHSQGIARRGISRCPELGDIVNHGYSVSTWFVLALTAGLDLEYVDRECDALATVLQENKQQVALFTTLAVGQFVESMRGRTDDPTVVAGSRFDLAALAPVLVPQGLGSCIGYAANGGMLASIMFGAHERAVEYAREFLKHQANITGSIGLAWGRGLSCLAMTLRAGDLEGEARDAMLTEARALYDGADMPAMALPALAEAAPFNFLSRKFHVEAEWARLAGDDLEAMRLYDEAVAAAQDGSAVHDAGLALEAAARFHLAGGRPRVARSYAEEAREAWVSWGAKARVQAMDREFADLLVARPGAAAARPSGDESVGSSLDLQTVTKASSAIAGEIVLDRLLERLMQILLENAGARRAVLLLPRDQGLRVAAAGDVEAEVVDVLDEPIGGSVPVAAAVVNYAARTLETVVIGDARTTQRFAGDAWLHDSGVRSLLCAPLVNQGELSAVVYLENDLAAEAFTPDRVELLRVLAGQAAIAIDHARIYDELRQRTEELERKNEELTELDRLRDQFLANTSHELRTPLNGIIGIAESLLEGATGPLPDATRDNLGLVVSSGRRLSNLVNDLLDFSTLQHRRITLDRRPVEVDGMVRAVLSLSQWLVGDKEVELVDEVPAGIGGVLADEERLEQILTNIVGNAIKFTEHGSVRVGARVPEDAPDMVVIEVTDTGVGIRKEVQERIFESFEQADGSTSRLFGGTGLGLAVAKELVHLHGGEIGVDSQPGRGSTFWFTLPATELPAEAAVSPKSGESLRTLREAPEPAEAAPAAAARGPVVVSAPDGVGAPKILVVDDDPTNLQVLVNQLSIRGFEVETAVSGLSALNLIDGGYRPDLVLLDVMMPTITGYDVTRTLRERFSPSELPIVLLTAKTLVRDLIEGLDAGANDYLTKPFSSGELLARLRMHLNLTGINRAVSRFVPADFLRLLERESIVDVRLGDSVERTMSVLFSDIRAFTSMSERMSPRENFSFINEYLGHMEPLVLEHQGFIDKFIGDAIMALFDRGADDAVRAGIAMLQGVEHYNEHRVKRGERRIRIGVGVNSGKLMLGTVGGQRRMDGTVISDAVNLGSRLEGLTKRYGVGMLLTEHSHALLADPDAYHLRLLDRIAVRGRKMPVTVYEVFDADSPDALVAKLETREAFEEGVNLYHHGDWMGAHEAFLKVSRQAPSDLAAEHYLDRCRRRVRVGADGVD